MYASIEDLRAEGVTAAMASDARLLSLLVEAGALLDRVTGWFFEPRAKGFQLDGRGTPTLELPAPPLQLDEVRIFGATISMPSDDLVIVGGPVEPGFDAPRFTLRRGVFPRGAGNVEASGLWGYTEPDGTPLGRTPLAIRRAVMLLVLRQLPKLTDADSAAARSAWRLLEERTRDQSYRLAARRDAGVVLTGDPEVDELIARYRRPAGLGAA
ncbi:MAG: hypothetical protein MUF64_31330 [Polyangiaceae bacterium]|nr:hypothetical protein [Polyangiaceae bacterium]